MASTFRFVWDGNVLLHETFKKDNSENTELTTWIFEGFVPTAKLVNGKAYSIIRDHLGTPILAIDSEGNEVWNRQLDIYGRVKREIKASSLGEDVRPFIPFLYQGQYYDFETNLAYNRYRYYSPETGAYISQDPIRLAGGNPTLYGYVKDSNWWVDRFGLDNSCGTTIYRGTNRKIEHDIAEETGYIMSDAAREAFLDAKYLDGRSNQEAIDIALKASQKAHDENVAYRGSLEAYVNAHSFEGNEIDIPAGRSMISFSTNKDKSREFGSTIYETKTNDFITQTKGGESEVLVLHMIKVN